MKTEEHSENKLKLWFGHLAVALGKVILKIVIMVVIGAIISYIVYYLKGYSFGATMRVVGIIFACIGLLSQVGENNIRGDYNYNMAKMRDSKMLANEHNGTMTSRSLMFLLWMGASGAVLILIGSALV